MGWRWVPGLQLTYRSQVWRRAGEVRVGRVEEWSYLVREFRPDGVAALHGRLIGVGAEVTVGDSELPRPMWEEAFAVEQQREGEVHLELGMDGQVVGIDALAFADALRHRVLGLRLPDQAMIPGEEWEDVGLLRSFAELLPARLPVRTDGTSELAGLAPRGSSTIAVVRTQGRVRSPSYGHSVVVHGESDWNADRGLLERRTLQARFLPESTDPIRQPGELSIEINLI
jgi:hypothetical protein